jgi:NAD(P)-dependent dehydrogenase (short-subunit alcohol dehydrogenase family)
MPLLEGKVALITGGSSGIGRATAFAFAREGARVVLAARGTARGIAVAEEIEAAGGTARFIACDVSVPNQVSKLIEGAVDAYGRLDCAFNNAASTDGVFKLSAEFSEDEFDRAITTNLKSAWLCLKYEIQQMLEQTPPGGAIVNTSSVNGLGGAARAGLYSAAKAGILALTKSAAQEYAQQGIRVNALVAGAFLTPMLEGVIEHAASGSPDGKKAVEARYTGRIALGRIGRAEEAAEAVVWLCSDAASYVTGHSMIVDGGWTASVR